LIGIILRRNCLLKHVIAGKIEGRIEVTGRGGRRPKQLLDYLNVVVPKVSFVDPKGFVTSSQWIHGYIFLIATVKLTYFLKNNG
jgi:hypothetical protein